VPRVGHGRLGVVFRWQFSAFHILYARGVVSMIPISKLALLGLVLGGVAGISSGVRAQGMRANPALAERGKKLFLTRSCDGCHSIGHGRRAGPDLLGVTDRRSAAWLRRWLKNTEEMILTDSLAIQMVADFRGYKMTNPRLSNEDIEALINYLAEGKKLYP